MNFDFADILLEVIEADASDLHMTAGSPPMVREKGRLRALDYPQLTPQDTREIVYSILNNEQRKEHILTIEDPIEFLHRHKNCIVNQRELGTDAATFADGLKAALRQDPDVILVGEMRDLETMSTALTAAETGHLVFATLHTQDTAQTVDRIVDAFPPAQQHQVRTQLSIALQGVITQQLVQTADGKDRVCATEVLVPTPGVRNLIREGKTHQIYSALQTGGAHGMQTMDASLVELVRGGKITQQMAERRSSTPDELRRLMGITGVGSAPAGPVGNGQPMAPGMPQPGFGNGTKVG